MAVANKAKSIAGKGKTNTGIVEGIAAARAGDVNRLRAWLDAGNNPNRYDAAGWTPLLWAAVRGHRDAVAVLLDNRKAPADIMMPQLKSGALSGHCAGHSGSVPTTELLIDRAPQLLDAVWDLNGHTILLQAVFYGHLDLAAFLLKKGAKTSITTARGLGPMELASQFQNQRMVDLIRPYDAPVEAKSGYYRCYLARIAPSIPANRKAKQEKSDRLIHAIEDGLHAAVKDESAVATTMETVRGLVEGEKADVNRLGGLLQQPPLVVTVTGSNGYPANPAVARLRDQLADYLLRHGADPSVREKHPMGAQTIIRASVFNHLSILKMCAEHMTAKALTDDLNEIPVVNGLTALHDTVLRSSMAAPDRLEGYLEQTRWSVLHGARSDIEDFAGRTQRQIAEAVQDPDRRRRMLKALEGKTA